jgi:microcystin-dependent protein
VPLETATYISDLNVANPAHTDGLSQADSHMRLTKAVLKAQFPNFTAAPLTSTQAALDNAAAAAAGTAISRFPLGTFALPGLTPVGDPNTGLWSPAADQLAFSLNGAQVLLMGGSALVTTLGIAAAAFTTTGAYSGGTGQLVPIGGTMLWWDDVLPTEGGYAWANGQIIASANTVCPILLARWGTRFGGDGITTMGVPDMREAVPVGKSTMGGVAARGLGAAAIWGALLTTLGALYGAATTALGVTNIPAHTHANTATVNDPGHVHGGIPNPGAVSPAGGGPNSIVGTTNSSSATTGITVTMNNASIGSGTAFNNVQASTTCNYIVRLG